MNPKRIVFVFTCISIICMAYGCSQESPSDRDSKSRVHYDRGMKYVDINDFKSARIEFKNAIQADPYMDVAHYQHALASLQLKDPKTALIEFGRAVELNPSNLDARLKLAELLFLAKRIDESRRIIRPILEKHDNFPDGHALMANILYTQKDFSNAKTLINRAIHLNPRTARYFQIRSKIFSAMGNPENAGADLKKALALAPEDPALNETLVRHYLKNKNREAAVSHLKTLTAAHPDMTRARILLGTVYEKAGDSKKAERVYLQLIENDPGNHTADLLLGNFYKSNGEFEKARNAYEQAFSKTFNTIQSLEVKTALAQLYFDQARWKQSEILTREILIEHPDHYLANLLMARLLIERQAFTKALTILTDKFDQEDHAYYKAVCNYGLGKIHAAEQWTARAVKQNQDNVMARAFMAHLLLLKGEAQAAEMEAAAALKHDLDNFKAAITLGESLLAQKKYNQALNHFNQMRDYYPENTVVLEHLGRTQLSAKQETEAESTFERILSIEPENHQAMAFLVRIDLNREDRAGAINRVLDQIKRQPKNPGLHLMLGKLYLEQKEYTLAMARFNRARHLDPDSAEAGLLAAKIHSVQGKTEEVIKEYQALLKQNNQLAGVYIKLGLLLEQTGEREEAKTVYREALAVSPSYGPVANNLACLLLDDPEPDLDKALELASVAESYAPENPYFNDTLGWVYHKRQAYNAAAKYLQFASSQLPAQPTVKYHYALNLMALEKKDQAVTELKECLASPMNFPERDRAERLIAKAERKQ